MKNRGDSQTHIAFFSTMPGSPWGGSEELWSKCALELLSRGIHVSASVKQWQPLHKRVQDLIDLGVNVIPRNPRNPLLKTLWQKATKQDITLHARYLRRLIVDFSPSLIVFSEGFILPPIELLELCVSLNQPFVTVSHSNDSTWWADDREAERYRAAIKKARRCFFVSHGNLALLEKQIAFQLPNAEVIWSPVNVPYNASPHFPKYSEGAVLRLAMVGRLHPPSKGQDVLIESLAQPIWRERNWQLSIYGEGNMKEGLQALVARFGLSDRISFAGFALPESIWVAHHALVMPSRYEGLPLTIIEAMLCGRAAVATNVGGSAEIILDNVTGFIADAPTVNSLMDALERMWSLRLELENIGKRAAQSIRNVAPPSPVERFSDALQNMIT